MALQKNSLVPDESGVLRVPEGTTVLDRWAFHQDKRITHVILPTSLREIGEGAFAECEALETVEGGKNVRKIGARVFQKCEGLREFIVPEQVTKIAANTFAYCSELRKVDVEGAVTDIGTAAFFGCSKLADIHFIQAAKAPQKGTVHFPRSLKSIGSDAFSLCTAIQRVVLDDTAESVGRCAFSHCFALQEVTCSSSVAVFDQDVFRECPLLTSVELPAGLKDDLRAHLGIPDADGFLVRDGVLWRYMGDAETVVVPDGVESVWSEAFRGWPHAVPNRIILPASLRAVGSSQSLLRPGVEIEPPRGFFQNPQPGISVSSELLDGPWRKYIHARELAALFLYGDGETADWAESQVQDPAAFMQTVLEVLQTATATPDLLSRAAAYWIRHRGELAAESLTSLVALDADRLQTEQDAAGSPFPEALLDDLMDEYEISLNCLGGAVKLRNSNKPAPDVLVKAAAVPYVLFARGLLHCGSPAPADMVTYLPEADAAASMLDHATLTAGLRATADQNWTRQKAYLFAAVRYASAGQLTEILKGLDTAWTGSDLISFLGNACLLNGTDPAIEMVQNAEPWTRLRENYRRLHPDADYTLVGRQQRLLNAGLCSQVSGVCAALQRRGGWEVHFTDRTGVGPGWIKADEWQDLYHRTYELIKVKDAICGQIQERLFDAYLSGKSLDFGWIRRVREDPLLGTELDAIIFQRGTQRFIWKDGDVFGPDGKSTDLGGSGGMQVAHATEIPPEEMDRWRQTFSENGWPAWNGQTEEPVYLPDGLPDAVFEGCRIDPHSAPAGPRKDLMLCASREKAWKLQGISRDCPGILADVLPSSWQAEQTLRRVNRVRYELDCLTALERAEHGSLSVLPRCELLNGPEEFLPLLEAAINGGTTELTGALLAIGQRRGWKLPVGPALGL